MWVFWIVTALMAAAAAALVIARAGLAARAAAAGGADPAQVIYRRQLEELDAQADDGVMAPEEHRAARAEAARRLLRAAETNGRRERVGGRRSRLAVTIAAAAAAAAALGGYVLLGSPALPDQPYAARLRQWRRSDPATLDPARMAAVLREIARARPHDPAVYDYLGHAEMAADDPFDAGRAFATASALAPGRADLLAEQGEALTLDAQGKVTPQALAAFHAALRLDPHNAGALYFIGRSEIAAGDLTEGLAAWRALAAGVALDDPRRPGLLAEIARVQSGGALDAGPSAGGSQPAGPLQLGPQAAFIHAMVARQAAELKAKPDNPEGWVRLVRAYGVLGDAAAQRRALSQARRIYARRPDVLGSIEAAASGRPAGG